MNTIYCSHLNSNKLVPFSDVPSSTNVLFDNLKEKLKIFIINIIYRCLD